MSDHYDRRPDTVSGGITLKGIFLGLGIGTAIYLVTKYVIWPNLKLRRIEKEASGEVSEKPKEAKLFQFFKGDKNAADAKTA